ncbi:glycosyltransferase [Thiomicrorhabdus sp. 6S3-12]|uniref:glycosyltransferase n=1 Tax=Thiomicrorhabdus sp. 6S3-12 TaxID=2819681 RepID=UPI001AAD66F2|nr:glycosyltransferase [Thiomicrorhabdus sp. 6S3-12]
MSRDVARFVTVIIPTYRDWDRLKLCFDALQKQSYPSDLFEVIAVNNDPQNPVPEWNLPENFKVLVESKVGSYAARNKGVANALATDAESVLAFTDSDCIPSEKWLEASVEAIEAGADRVAGRVELFYLDDQKLTAAEKYEKAFMFDQKKSAKRGLTATANLVVRRGAFDYVGEFNSTMVSGGDTEWSRRATKKGVNIVYSEGAMVKHPARSSLQAIFKKAKRVAGGSVFMKDGRRRLKVFSLFRSLIPPVIKYIRLLFTRKDLSFNEASVACLVLYFLNIYKGYIKFGVSTGLMKPERE